MKRFVYSVHGETGYCVPPQPKTVYAASALIDVAVDV
jgi:hypothetical protein